MFCLRFVSIVRLLITVSLDGRYVSHLNHIKFKISYDFNYKLLEVKKYIKCKEFLRAYDILSEMLKIGISHSDVYFLIGELCYLSSHYDIAFSWFKKAISFEKYYSKCLYYLGIILIKHKSDQSSINDELSHNKSINHFKDYNEGMDYLIKFIEIDNKSAFSASAFYVLSECYFQIKEYENALESINKAIKIHSDSKYLFLKDCIISKLFNHQSLVL